MKKERTGKRILGLLMAVLMIVQLPLTALAENMEAGEFSISEYTEEVIEPTVETVADDMFSDGTDFMDTENASDTVIIEEEKILEEDASYEVDFEDNREDLESEEQIFENIEEDGFLESVETVDENEEIMLFSDTEESEEQEEPQTITVKVSISNCGEFLDDKNGKPMAGRELTLSGQTSYTMADALRAAHIQYYKDGLEGCDCDSDAQYVQYGIHKLWGYEKENVVKFYFTLNHANLVNISSIIEDGDELHYFIKRFSNTDDEKEAYFEDTEIIAMEGEDTELYLRRQDGYYTNTVCEGAVLYIDGEKQENLVTDSKGAVTLPKLAVRETPYLITVGGTLEKNSIFITAAYTWVTVVESGNELGEYLENVTLENSRKDCEQKNVTTLTMFDGSDSFKVPTGIVYCPSAYDPKMYLRVDLASDAPEDCDVYAVYTNWNTGAAQRTKLTVDEATYLPNAIAKKAFLINGTRYPKAIDNIKVEVRKAGVLLQSCNIPIQYKDHLNKIQIKDSFGNKDYNIYDTTWDFTVDSDDKQLEVTIPANAEYLSISVLKNTCIYYQDNKAYKIVLNGKEITDSKIIPDWSDGKDSFTLDILLSDPQDLSFSNKASYTLTVKKGEINYTPKVTLTAENMIEEIMWPEYAVYKGDDPVTLKANVDVVEAENGKLSYSWYYAEPICSVSQWENYIKIDGAETDTYVVSTDEERDHRAYVCVADYEVNGEHYQETSGRMMFAVIPENVEVPQISQQPQNLLLQAGQPVKESLTLSLEDAPKVDLHAEYQWYRNTEDDTNSGQAVTEMASGNSSYKPDVPASGTVYYYCKVRYYRYSSVHGIWQELYSEEVCSEPAAVTRIEEAMPWEGKGTSDSPYQIQNFDDLTALRDKVNNDNFSFAGISFVMTADIDLPADWTPIGTLEPGQSTTGLGKYIRPFSGIFDGKGHTLTMANGGKPLFNYVRNAVIENLKLAGTNINGYGLIDNYAVDYGTDGVYNTGCPEAATIRNITLVSGMSTKKAGLIGGYASGANKVTIENCTAEAGVTIGYGKNQSSIGTFAGAFNGVIRNCHSEATVYGSDKVGGLAGSKGQSMGACRIENSSFAGTVTASGNWVGGILGSGYEADSAPNTPVASIINCYMVGNISGRANVGGIFGGEPSVKQCWGNGGGGITNNFFYGTVSGSSNVGAVIGYLRSFDKFQNISNNYYLDTCGAAQGIGAIGVILSAEGVSQTLPFEYDASYGIDYVFDQNQYCFAKTASEFADGTVRAGLNSGDYSNWAQGIYYPVYGQGAYATGLTLSGDYKKEYYLGDALDLSGGTFTVTWSDGSKTHPQADEITVIGYDSNKRGSQMLQLKYGAVETTITVSVILKTGQIEVKFILYGDSIHDSDSDHNYHTLTKGNLEIWIPETTYIVSNNTKVKDVLEQALKDNNMTCENASGNYVSAITRNGVKLEEFSNGKYSGWMYTLNGKHPDLGVNEQYLNSGDVIIFHYTDYYVEEEHEHQWSDQWQSNDTAHWHECEYSCGQQKDLASHSWNAGVITKTATCTQDGVQTYTCSVCGAEKTEKIAASGHKFGSWKKASDATVFTAEIQKRSCSLCGASETTKVGSKLTPVLELPGKLTSISIKKGNTKSLNVTMANGDSVASVKSNTPKTLKATLDKNGKITLKALKKGSAKLTVKLASGKSRTYKVSVVTGTVKTTKLTVTSVTNNKLTLEKGKTHTLKSELKPFTSTQKVTYKTSNKKVATVTSSGKIKAVGAGKATITVTSGSKKVKVIVTVPGITGLKSSVTVKRNKTTTLKPKTYGISEKVTYTSSNPKVVTVTAAGKVKGIKKGTAKITVQAESYKKTVTVKVK